MFNLNLFNSIISLAEILCSPPAIPQHGYMMQQGNEPDKEKYRGGDMVQFGCNTGYMRQGNTIIVCQENMKWSGPSPNCKLINH